MGALGSFQNPLRFFCEEFQSYGSLKSACYFSVAGDSSGFNVLYTLSFFHVRSSRRAAGSKSKAQMLHLKKV